jgi:hypothetical protein
MTSLLIAVSATTLRMMHTHLCMLCWWCALASSLLAAALLHTRRCCTAPACLLRPPGPSSLRAKMQASNTQQFLVEKVEVLITCMCVQVEV